ncbi:hypothetical protein V6U77_10970 [Micromonospora sp. CPCC 205546]|uniref:hypothetical protein n=1 Tax=Micromonospora sp. CPCC 205546 TaxID=3122397 RepID=UPI002FF38A4A
MLLPVVATVGARSDIPLPLGRAVPERPRDELAGLPADGGPDPARPTADRVRRPGRARRGRRR